MFYVSSGIITRNTGFVKYFRPEFENFEKANQETDFALIRNALIKSYPKRLIADVPIGVYSGGLDSSLITAIAARLQAESGKITVAIGLDANAPDVAVATLKTEHNEIYFTVQDGIEIIQEITANRNL
jgi:asparagine synthase (glutamine-hydrolysing)